MTNQLAKRALGTAFAAALVLGGAACGDDDAGTDDQLIEEDLGEVEGGIEGEGEGEGEGLGD